MKRGLKSIHTNRHDALRMASARMFEQISSITYFFALQGKHEDVRTNIKHLLPYFFVLQGGGSDAVVDVLQHTRSSTQHHVALFSGVRVAHLEGRKTGYA